MRQPGQLNPVAGFLFHFEPVIHLAAFHTQEDPYDGITDSVCPCMMGRSNLDTTGFGILLRAAQFSNTAHRAHRSSARTADRSEATAEYSAALIVIQGWRLHGPCVAPSLRSGVRTGASPPGPRAGEGRRQARPRCQAPGAAPRPSRLPARSAAAPRWKRSRTPP
jgi:hypothetical protein